MPHLLPIAFAQAGGTMIAEGVTGEDLGVTSTIQKILGTTPDMTSPAVPAVPEQPDPVAEQAKATEEARQSELEKRRRRVKTLLSSQEETGMATVGKKTLLGG